MSPARATAIVKQIDGAGIKDTHRCHDQNEFSRALSSVRHIDEISVEPHPDGARVTYDAELILRRPLRLFDPVLARSFRKIGDRAAAGLRRALGAATG